MSRFTTLTSRTGVMMALLLAACSRTAEPKLASSAQDPGYASRYPEDVDSMTTTFEADQATLDDDVTQFSRLPDKLKDTDYEIVLRIVDEADEAGTSESYGREAEHVGQAQHFFEQEKKEIVQRVGGANNHHAKENHCDVDFYGPTTYSLGVAVQKQSEERLRESNPAQRIIEENERVLGKANEEPLEDAATQITRASYLVNVGLVKRRMRLEQLVGEGGSVKSTLEDEIKRLETVPEDEDRLDKKDREERLTAYKESLAEVDGKVEAAKQALADVEKLLKDKKAAYDKALGDLKSKLKEAARDAEKNAEKKEKK